MRERARYLQMFRVACLCQVSTIHMPSVCAIHSFVCGHLILEYLGVSSVQCVLRQHVVCIQVAFVLH